ncbi:MAG TPA: TetR/AcrR family transcriptional regulator [Solirubrobacterales bacterium]
MSAPDRDEPETPAPSGDLRLAQGQSTRALLLAAAGDLLRQEGYAATSTRAVADRAGARLSLVHYHFGSKRGLLLAVLEDLTERLLHRQQAMFNDGRAFADQWRTACDYLREDIHSGYVRILWELWAAGLADPELAERWRATQRSWRELIEARLERLQAERGVELPMPPRVLATLIGSLFEGAEVEILAGVPEDETPHLEALEACAALIAHAERR